MQEQVNAPASKNPPAMVTPTSCFRSCIFALKSIFSPLIPPVIQVRSTKMTVLVYGFVDASGSSFGGSIQREGKLTYKIGTWSSAEDKNSSNWREFENLVCEVEHEAKRGNLVGSYVFLGMDNEVVESSLFKGN